MANNYGASFITGAAEVRWSHLMKPDDKFGNPHHSVTVVVTPELQKQLDSSVAELGGSKINGMKSDESGDNLIRFKNNLKAKEGIMRFPILDSEDKETKTVPFATDKVRIRVTPALLERDGSVSFYMDKVQLIERNWTPSGGSASSGGMGKVDGGFVADDSMSEETVEQPF
jgi:hypothetical protein